MAVASRRRRAISSKSAVLGAVVSLAPLLSVVAVVWACTPQAFIALDRDTYEAGSPMTVTGLFFPPQTSVTVNGLAASTTVQSSATGGFVTTVVAPEVPGDYVLYTSGVTPSGEPIPRSPAAFTVVARPPEPVVIPPPGQPPPAEQPPPPPAEQTVPSAALAPDLVGPRILRPQRSRETIAVTRSGSFTVFCGRFDESSVTGSCGLVSTRRIEATGQPVLRLAQKPFRAWPGRRVTLRFQLSPVQLQRLRSRGRLRMRANVVADDLLGNRRLLTFGVTLKAPD
jgi:hypothetical protein